MTYLLKLGFGLALFFASTFIIIKTMGWITIEDVRGWLEAGKTTSPHMVGLIVAGLLFADLFIAVPTLTITLLSGYFLGFELGFAYALSGYWLAGSTGYALSRAFGRRALRTITKDTAKITQMDELFSRHGLVVLSMARAVPILAEVSACLSGATKFARGALCPRLGDQFDPLRRHRRIRQVGQQPERPQTGYFHRGWLNRHTVGGVI